MFFRQCRVSRLTVIVDPSKQAEALAREPDHVVVELFNHLFVIRMSVSAMEPIPRAPIPGFICFIVAQGLVLVEVSIPDEDSESVCPL